jgi:hypothetical protein
MCGDTNRYSAVGRAIYCKLPRFHVLRSLFSFSPVGRNSTPHPHSGECGVEPENNELTHERGIVVDESK